MRMKLKLNELKQKGELDGHDKQGTRTLKILPVNDREGGEVKRIEAELTELQR